MDPVITYYDSVDVLISSGNPVQFLSVDAGTASSTVTIWVWNDRSQAGSDSATTPKFHVVSGPDDASAIFDGTTYNSSISMLEARSCGAQNVSADRHSDWTPIGPTDFLSIGTMPAYSAREIELRLNVPADAAVLPLVDFTFRMQY